MMALLDIRAWLAIACAALVAVCGLQQVRVSHAKAATAEVRAELANVKTTYAQAAQKAEADARAEESRRTEATRKVIADAQSETAVARADAVRAVSAADRLRKRTADLAARSCPASDPAAPDGSKTAAEAAGLLAYVRSRLDEAEGRTIEFADGSSIAGAACQRQYESLKP